MKTMVVRITDWCQKNSDLYNWDHETVQYGIEVFLNTFMKLLIILVAAIFIHRFGETILVLSIFGSLRKYAGGYHCKTHWGCLGEMLLISFCPALFEQLSLKKFMLIWIILIAYAIYAFWQYTPRNSMINPINDPRILLSKKRKCRILCGLIILLFILLPNSKIRWLIIIPFFTEAVTISPLFYRRGRDV